MALDNSAQIATAGEQFRQGRLSEAERELRAVLNRSPHHLQALTLLAGVCFRTERLKEAGDLLGEVLEEQPERADAIGLLAIVRRTQADYKGAAELFQRLIQHGHESADVYSQVGACKMELKDWVGAGIAFKRAVELDRTRADTCYHLGMALKMAGTNFESFVTFKRAIQLDPKHYDSYVQLWNCMRQLLNWEEGLPIMEQGLRVHSQSVEMMVMGAITYGKVGKIEQAEELFKKAIAADPESALPYSHWLQEEGRFEESIPVLAEAIKRRPMQGQAYYNLAMAKRFDIEGRSLTEVAPEILQSGDLDDEQRMFLHYAIAKAYDSSKHYELAMRNYEEANRLAYGLYIHESGKSADSESEKAMADIYTRERFESLFSLGSKNEIPIFIVGMIRTGTTLIDQILSSHRDISSAGEQPFWQIAAGRFNHRWLERGPTAQDLSELESGYLASINASQKGATRITDKMPTNFWQIGMMALAFPRARFVHTRRNPMDTVLSIYTTFLGAGTQFAYDQANIVEYYKGYLRTMDFWRSVLPPGRMIEIDYEELVRDKERVIRGVIEFCGLDWDPACLQHEQNQAHVSTPSLFTARQPVTTASVERWRKYEPWLGQLLELKDVSHPTVV